LVCGQSIYLLATTRHQFWAIKCETDSRPLLAIEVFVATNSCIIDSRCVSRVR